MAGKDMKNGSSNVQSAAPRAKRAVKVPRKAAQGDIAPTATPTDIETFEVSEAVDAAESSKLVAVRDIIKKGGGKDIGKVADQLGAIMKGASPDDLAVLRKALFQEELAASGKTGVKADDELADDWRTGGYPYRNLMSRKNYEKQKYHLQVELLKLQKWVKETGQKVVILFEGRDAAGKGGTIKRFMEHLNPRGARVVALEKPSDVERRQWLYHLSDTIVVRLTGHVKLDGSCAGGTPLYGFQRKEGDAWTDYLPPCDVQLCCGMPSSEWVQHTVGLIPQHIAMPGRGRPWKPGEYRAVVLLVGDKELVGPPFTVVDEE